MGVEIKVNVRRPPLFIEGTQDETWTPTPKNWLYGSWKMTHTSQTYYFERTKNFIIQYAPVLNGEWPCANQELVSLTPIAQPDRLYTAYGIDSPIPNLDDAWLCQCTGHLSHISDYVAFLSWGTDASAQDWVVLYSTPPPGSTVGLPAQIAIMSRGDIGLDEETVNRIKSEIIALGDVELSKMVHSLRRLEHDDVAKRSGAPSVWIWCAAKRGFFEQILILVLWKGNPE